MKFDHKRLETTQLHLKMYINSKPLKSVFDVLSRPNITDIRKKLFRSKLGLPDKKDKDLSMVAAESKDDNIWYREYSV